MTRWIAPILVVVTGLALGLVPAGVSARGSGGVAITSISPSAAPRGAVVTITSTGFGARNVRVSVGGVAAQVVSATGARVEFRVPDDAPIGTTTVRATNPGSRSGEIRFEVQFDGTVRPVADAASSVGALIGPAGGSITAGPVTLAVPPGALLNDQQITVTPLRAVDGSPLGQLVAGAELEPQGLRFLTPAHLSLTLPAGLSPADVVGFGFDGAGASFHLAPHTLTGATVTVPVSHFSGAGAATATSGQVATALSYTPTAADQLYSQHIAAALFGDAQTGADANTDPRIDDALNLWFVNSVLPNLVGAQGGSEAALEQAAGEWLAWEEQVQLNGRSGRSPFAGEHAQAFDHATTDAADLADRTLARCDGSGNSPLSAAAPVTRIAAVSETLALPIETRTGPSQKTLPSALDLAHACFHLTLGPVARPGAFAFGPHNTVRTSASVAFWTGASRTDIATRVELLDATDGSPLTVASTTTTSGSAAIAYTGSSTAAGHRFFRVHASLAGAGAAFADDERSFDLDVRPRVDLQSDATVQPGDHLTLQLLLAGDGMANAAVTFALTGTGTLGQTGATTDSAGRASVDYTAATSVPESPDTVTASFDDGNGPATDSVTITVRPRVTVTVSPHSITLSPHDITEFTVTVTGTTNHAVRWSTTDPTGSIDVLGLNDYIAGDTPGIYTVTATSLADPTASDTAIVTIAPPAGVTRQSSSARAGADLSGVPSPPDCPTGNNHSPPDATNATVQCAVSGSTTACSGSAEFTTTFDETFVGSTLTDVTASGQGTEQVSTFLGFLCAEASGDYSLIFRVEAPVRITIDGTISGASVSNVIHLSGPSASSPPLLERRVSAVVDTSFVLQRGTYTFAISADANNLESSTGSFSVTLAFRSPD
jgi:hypothetical protein